MPSLAPLAFSRRLRSDMESTENLKNEIAELKTELLHLRDWRQGQERKWASAWRWCRRLSVAGALLLAGIPVVSLAIPALPQASDGEIITAQMWNENFQALVDGITAIETGTTRVRGNFCAETEATNGNMGGYSAADAMCSALPGCETTTAHMCTASEVVRIHSSGGALPEGWYSTGIWSDRVGGTETVNDCSGFESSSSNDLGVSWSAAGPNGVYCSTTRPVICCDVPPP